MEDLVTEVVRVWSSTSDLMRTLLVLLLAAFFVACIRSARMSIAKMRRINENRPSSKRKIDACDHYFPPAKRGQLVKCKFCPKTLRRPK